MHGRTYTPSHTHTLTQASPPSQPPLVPTAASDSPQQMRERAPSGSSSIKSGGSTTETAAVKQVEDVFAVFEDTPSQKVRGTVELKSLLK